jgi:hypothetical protein
MGAQVLDPRGVRPRVPGPDAQFGEMAERFHELPVPESPFRPLDQIEQPGARVGGLPCRIAPVAS